MAEPHGGVTETSPRSVLPRPQTFHSEPWKESEIHSSQTDPIPWVSGFTVSSNHSSSFQVALGAAPCATFLSILGLSFALPRSSVFFVELNSTKISLQADLCLDNSLLMNLAAECWWSVWLSGKTSSRYTPVRWHSSSLYSCRDGALPLWHPSRHLCAVHRSPVIPSFSGRFPKL